jgi:hypothetical protein
MAVLMKSTSGMWRHIAWQKFIYQWLKRTYHHFFRVQATIRALYLPLTLAYSWNLKMEAVHPSRTSVTFTKLHGSQSQKTVFFIILKCFLKPQAQKCRYVIWTQSLLLNSFSCTFLLSWDKDGSCRYICKYVPSLRIQWSMSVRDWSCTEEHSFKLLFFSYLFDDFSI